MKPFLAVLTVVVMFMVGYGIMAAYTRLQPAEKIAKLSTSITEQVANINQVLAIAKKLEGFAEIDPLLIESVLRDYPKLQKEIAAINKELETSNATIKVLQSELKKPEPVIVEVPEECTEVVNTLVEAIEVRDIHIEKLEAINTQQGVTIQLQTQIIERQTTYIDLFREAQQATMRQANRRALMGVAAGVIISLIL
jgi:chromosome segregation ATPase